VLREPLFLLIPAGDLGPGFIPHSHTMLAPGGARTEVFVRRISPHAMKVVVIGNGYFCLSMDFLKTY
jgi:hypothetical protein